MSEQKVLCYITREGEDGQEVLAYRMPENRKAGVQVPSTDLNSGENKEEVVVALAKNSSGLTDLQLIGALGDTFYYDLNDDVSYQRFFFHFTTAETRDEWESVINGEQAIFHWIPVMGATKKIYWDQAKMLRRIKVV